MFSSVLYLYYDYDVTPFLIVDFVGISFLVRRGRGVKGIWGGGGMWFGEMWRGG